MLKLPAEERVHLAKTASLAAIKALANKIDPYKEKYGASTVKHILSIASGAKQRCTNANCIGFSNYGGRGISFNFPSARAFMEWVLDNLDSRPSQEYSIDRIDNNRGYEPGNLRWATKSEQARNKRAYKRTKVGERIRHIKDARSDLTYETIRTWVIQGLTDEEILNRGKYASAGI